MISDRLMQLKDQVYELHKKGVSQNKISQQMRISRNSVANLLKVKEQELEASKTGENEQPKSDEIQGDSPPIPETKKPEGAKSPYVVESSGKGKKAEKDEQDIEDKIVDGAEKGFIKLAGSSLSKGLLEDLKINLETAKRIKKYELMYKADIETLGFDWFDFIDIAFTRTFRDLVESIKKQGEEDKAEIDGVATGVKLRMLMQQREASLDGR